MGRRRSVKQDSLELLLDTICNTFGGVLFIAILVVLLLQQTSANPANDRLTPPPTSEVEIQSLANRLEAATTELSRLSENRESQQAIVARFAPLEVRELLEQRREVTVRQNEVQIEVDRLRLENARTVARTESLREESNQLREDLVAVEERHRQAEQTLEKERKARIEDVRLPVIRSTNDKSEIGLILRYGRLYVWHRYGKGNVRLGLNTDEFVVISESDKSLVTRPIPTKGVALDGSQSSKEAIRQVLSQFDQRSCYLVMIVRPDTYEVFKHVRDVAIAMKFEYRLIPMDENGAIEDRGGTGGQVQ